MKYKYKSSSKNPFYLALATAYSMFSIHGFILRFSTYKIFWENDTKKNIYISKNNILQSFVFSVIWLKFCL